LAVAGFAAVRIFITLGWVASLIALSVAHPARAEPKLIEQSTALPDFEPVIASGKTRAISGQNEQAQPAATNNLSPELGTDNDIEFEVTPVQNAGLAAALGLSGAASPSQFALLQQDSNVDDDSVHEIAIAFYHAVADMNNDVAADLLSSYRIFSRVHTDIIAAVETPLDLIDLSNDGILPQGGLAPGELADGNDRYDGDDHVNGDQFFKRIRFLFSLDAVPYYIFVSTLYVGLAVFRAAYRRLARRSR
jgi:hypothetical protein